MNPFHFCRRFASYSSPVDRAPLGLKRTVGIISRPASIQASRGGAGFEVIAGSGVRSSNA